MKKILVMLMCFVMLLASCEKKQITNDAFSESSSLQESSSEESSPSEESSSVDEPSPDIPPEPDTLGIKTTAKTVEEIKLDCYKELGVYIGSYTGEKPSEKNGDFYRIVDNYEDFEELATKAYFLDKKTFDDYNALILYRQYKKEHYAKIGVSNFKIENGKATMDRYVYTGSNFLEDMVENDTLEDESYINCEVDYYLVPKTNEFKATEKLEPITLNKIEFDSYAVRVSKINGLQRDDVLVLTSYNELVEFRNKYNAHDIYFDRYYGYEDDCFYIVLPQIVEKDIVAADAKLDGSTLKLNMLQMHDSYNYTNPKNAVIIEIPYTSRRYEPEKIMDAEELTHDEILDAEKETDEEVIVYFEQLPKDIKIELTVYDCDNRKYYPTLTEEEWDSAIDATISAENYTMQYEPNCRIGINGSIFQGRIIYKYTSGMYHESSHAKIVRHMGGKRTIVDSAHGMFVDYENNKTIITTGNIWTNADDGYVHDCHFKEIDISKFKGIFKGATLQKDGSYRVSQHGNRFNVKVIIANGRLHYLGFNTVLCEYGYDEHHAFYFYDYDQTEIIEPELGSTFEFKY